VLHLEEIAAFRERIVVERDAQLAQLNALREALQKESEALHDERDGLAHALGTARHAVAAQSAECERLERAIAAQERIIAYRQSARWWIALPWLRVRLWWQRIHGE
jgi:predicted  nucleic acid-binding Zn-ribbon protein